MNYCLVKLDPIWAKCLKSGQNFSRSGQKKIHFGHCWRWLTQAELADWQYQSGNTNTDSKLITRSTLPTNMRQLWQNSCIFSSRLMTTPYTEEMLPTRFQVTVQSEQHWHANAEIEGFICCKLKSINECTSRSNMPENGRESYVLFFKITFEIKT